MMGKMEIRSPPGSRPRDGRHCDLCGCSQPAVRCDKCGCQIFCLSCDDMYHRHPKRRFHLRKAVDPIPTMPQARPVLPVKVSHLNTVNPGDPSKMPLPPPRKKKSLFGSFRKPSPSDNSPPLPKKEYSWTDRLGSIKKFMSNRPLPPLPVSDDNDTESQPTTNGQSPRGDLTFIHRKNDERPPQLPQRSPRTPELPGVNQEKENRIPSFPTHMHGQIRNGSLEVNANHMNQNREFPINEQNQWNNRMNNQTGPQVFGTLNRQTHQRGFMPPGAPGYPGGMHQSSSATDLHNLNNAEGMPGAGPMPPHYPHYPMNPHMPPHYPYPMYPQYPNYPQYFGNSFANLSNPQTSEGDFSDSESASRHSSKKHPFRKRAKRSQSVMMDRMAFPGQFFPFGPYPGYGPWGAPMPMEAPPSPASSVRSLTRTGRGRRRKKMTSEDDDDDEEFSVSSSPMSRPKSSSSDPKEQPKAPLATQTTSSEDESYEDAADRRNKIETMRRQSEPVRLSSPAMENKQISKLKKSSSKQSDSDTQEIPEVKSERRPSKDSTTESPQLVQQKPPTPIPSDSWECKHCTFINPIGNRICQVCCKTASPRVETPVTGNSRPSSAAAANSRKESVGSEKECSSPDKVPEAEDDSGKKDKQDMASLNSALDEAEKQISRGLEELMKLKDDIDANVSKEKLKSPDNQPKSGNEENSKPTYRSSGKMRTSILDKLNLNKPQSSNTSVSTSTETQTGNSNWTSDKIVEARRHSNSSTTSETYNSPLAQSPELDGNFLGNKQKRDSSCQTQQDTINDYLEKRKASEEAFLGRPINNFGFGYGDRMDMVTSPVPSMYDRFFGGGYGMMQRSHSRASLFTGRMNDLGPMDYGGPGFGYGPAPMYRSVSRGSLTGDYPDGRLSEFHNLRKPDFYLSMEELVERRRQDNIRAQGLELVRMIREAEQQGFNADDIQVALTHCGKQNPLEWLQENWRNMVDSVVTLSTNYGNDKKENDIGVMSENEARDALRLHKGNIWAAVTECVEGRQRKYLELSARGNFSRQDIVDALACSEGDVEIAYAKLTKSTGKPFLMRIWGAGEGAQNQDGAQQMPDDFLDGPRKYLKDDTPMSDEMSEELWSEDGEWDDEEEYEEERGDIEDLQTCHEDLQTSPQEMRTPESDKSDYCDAFPVDDRNVSSPSDDIFFVIPEAKPEKKKGFLSKLVALRKDSKEQSGTVLNASKNAVASEQSVQPTEDTISQKSNSSSEQPKNNGALNTLKSTLSAIKDTVTGGTKSDKKFSCAQPERRTIIVKGQIDNEPLSSSSKDNVKLNSVKPLDDEFPRTKSEDEYNEPTKHTDYSSNKETVKNDRDSKSSEDNLKYPNQSQPNKSSSENASDQVESKTKVENKKSQSLAERLKFAKQTRPTTSTSSTSVSEKENSIHDSKLNDSTQIGKEKVSSNKNKKDESNLQLDLPSPERKDMHLKTETDKATDITADTSYFKTAEGTQNQVASGTTAVSLDTSPIFSSQDTPEELNVMSKAALSENETLSTKSVNSNNLKSINQIKQSHSSKNKTEELTNKTTNRPHSVSPKLESSQTQKTLEDNSTKISGKENDKNDKIDSSDIIKPGTDPKSDISKSTSNVLHNQTVSEMVKNDNKLVKQKIAQTTEEQVLTDSCTIENVSVVSENVNEIALNGTTSKDISETDKSVYETSKIQADHANANIEISQTLNESPEMTKTSEYEKTNAPGTSDNQNSEFKSENTENTSVKQENKVEETMIGSKVIKDNLDGHANADNLQKVTAEESSNKKHKVEEPLKIQTEMTSKSCEVQETHSEIKPNKTETAVNVQECSSVQISMERSGNDVPKAEAVPESVIQLKEQVVNLSTMSSVQNMPDNIVEQSTTENSKMEIDSNKSDFQKKVSAPDKTAELVKPEQTYAESNSNTIVKEKDVVSEQIIGPPQTPVQDNETKKTKVADIKPNQNLEARSESSQEIADGKLNLGKDTPAVLPENQNDPTSAVTDIKSSKIKSSKIKIKKSKSQEKDKKESKDKIHTKSEELLSSNGITNESPDNKSLAEKIMNDKEIENESAAKVSQSESKVITEDTHIKISEESKLQTSDDGNKSLTLEKATEISPEPTQNASTSELQNSLSDVVITPSTSKAGQTEVQEIPKPSENELNVDNSKEVIQNSSEINKAVSQETEFQSSKASNQVQENKSIFATGITTSEDVNVANNSEAISTSNASDNSEMMTISSSTTAPLDDKTVSSSTKAPDNSETLAESTSSVAPDSSEAIVTATSSASDSSKTTITSANSSTPDSPKTLTTAASSVAPDSSKITIASTSSVTPDSSKATVSTASSSATDSSKTTEATANSAAPDSSKTTIASENLAASDSSKTTVTSTSDSSKTTTTSSAAPDSSKTTVAPAGILGNSKTTAASSSTVIPDNSLTVATSSSVPGSSKVIEASTSTTISNNSNEVATSGISKPVTDEKSLNKDMIKDAKISVVPKITEQHSKVQDNAVTDIPTSVNNKISSPTSTVPQPENNLLKRTVSEDGSTSQAADSDDTDIEDLDESRPSSVTPPSPVDALRNRFEVLAGNATVRGAPIRPASPFRRMSFNSRKQVIALEKKRDTSVDKPWFHQKIVKEPVKLPQPKRTIKQQLELERKVRKMVADRKCRTYRKAEIVVQLMDMNFEEEEAIQAAHECSTLEQAISYLQQECLLCAGHFPVSQIVCMTHCEHRACRDCIRAYFTVQIRDRTILDLLCPFCNEPDIGDEDVAQDYFNHLDIMLKKLVDFEIHELFQRKLRDRVLMKDPNFRWCSQCSSGFISMPNLTRLICPDCNAVTCAFCRRLWEKEHQGISCEAFAALKDASDPEAQAAGLAKFLTEDGIDCPSCHFRYALAKGGCMHFRCIQCQHDFCSGCSRPFKMGQKCGVSEFCAKLGLHAHHPRNCLFYLRDKEPEDLQKLLDMNDVKYNREPPDGMELKSICQVMEQKETPDGMVDDYCGKEVQDGYAGLCRVHYVEYLGQLVNKHKVDPIQIFDNDDLELVLRRANIRLPPKRYRETDAQYREKLVNLIEEELPLDRMDGS